jgi:hypothetical protein
MLGFSAARLGQPQTHLILGLLDLPQLRHTPGVFLDELPLHWPAKVPLQRQQQQQQQQQQRQQQQQQQ